MGERTNIDCYAFLSDLKSRLKGRVQLTTDGHRPYLTVIERLFGADGVDFAMLHGTPTMDSVYWTETMTPRQVAVHVRLVNHVDTQYPIILGSDFRVMDGMHRVLRALVEGRELIDTVQFEVDPTPDYFDVAPAELSYPDGDSN